ncbi:class 1 fructose-bisphosphatase [Halorhodospira neutriphila]|uniref:Fructose-1,6-bisphosphatase class 1 n=1 Tax=Halorhodospira neutriphila TaxID=168379 RepID=A0ABS1E6V6_9GAMM|nr:class 1 fructose-bisphosphatase [Halorhodospira neutriphila]MBK1727440.1 fructose-bisphosphatase class I [Halorhodospira neutriphila]
MPERVTLARYLAEQRPETRGLDELSGLVQQVTDACKGIADAVRGGALRGVLGSADAANTQGEEQKTLDVLANERLKEAGLWGGRAAAVASEEEAEAVPAPAGQPSGPYLLLFDPLDGSSNIEVNVSVGTIFSILKAPSEGTASIEDFMQPGTEQVAAGFVVYGPSTTLLLTLGNGVAQFTLDHGAGEFVLVNDNVQIPAQTKEFAINVSYQRFWEAPVRRYIDECLQGEDGPRGKNFNMRWIASMVADMYRIFTRGGIFIYPRDANRPDGRLRLMYEANPMAFLAEQAGGAATDAHQRILERAPEQIHQKVPVVIGSKEEVDRLTGYHQAS